MHSRDREAICPIGLGVFVESFRVFGFNPPANVDGYVSIILTRRKKKKLRQCLSRERKRQTDKPCGEIASLGIAMNVPHCRKQRKRPARPGDMRAGWSTPKAIR